MTDYFTDDFNFNCHWNWCWWKLDCSNDWLTGLLMITERLSNKQPVFCVKRFNLSMADWTHSGQHYCYMIIYAFFFPVVGTWRSYYVPVWLNHHHSCLPGHLPSRLLQLPLPWFSQQVNRWSNLAVSLRMASRTFTKAFHDHFVFCPGRLTSFYETAVPDLEKAVRKRNFDDKGWVPAAFITF